LNYTITDAFAVVFKTSVNYVFITMEGKLDINLRKVDLPEGELAKNRVITQLDSYLPTVLFPVKNVGEKSFYYRQNSIDKFDKIQAPVELISISALPGFNYSSFPFIVYKDINSIGILDIR